MQVPVIICMSACYSRLCPAATLRYVCTTVCTGAMATKAEPELQCPVCHDDYTDPKILPCAHLVCSQCVLSWLTVRGEDAGCPLCREKILTPSFQTCDLDVAAKVKALPSDLSAKALVRSRKVLNEDRVCSLCEDDVTATSHCSQCDLKLCDRCVRSHKKVPFTAGHVIEQLDQLSIEKLAAASPTMCRSHPDKPVELFCSQHQLAICVLCVTTTHDSCHEKKTIADMAKEKKAEFSNHLQQVKLLETAVANEVLIAVTM